MKHWRIGASRARDRPAHRRALHVRPRDGLIYPSGDDTKNSKSRTGWLSEETDSLIITVKSDMIRVTHTGLSV